MTREEALNKAINIVSYFEAHFAKSKEAREDAVNIIEALEQEPQQVRTHMSSADCISRQAVHEAITRWAGSMSVLVALPTREVRPLLDSIHKLPSVKPQEPKTVLYSGDGYADGYMVYDMAECPNCGRKFEYGDETWNCKFCPDCGQALNWERSDKE